MDAVEKAIRTAFEKGDPRDRAFREKVYRSVYAALDRAIAAKASIAPEAVEQRRSALKQTIVRVEREFLPAQLPRAPEAGSPAARIEPTLAVPAAAAPPKMPVLRAVSPADEEIIKVRDDPDFHGGDFPDGPDPVIGPAPKPIADDGRADLSEGSPRRPRRRGFAAAFLALMLVAAIAAGGWWASSLGLLRSAAERDTSVPNPSAGLEEEEDFAPEGESARPPPLGAADDGMRDWITVFSPADPTAASAPGDARAEVVTEGDTTFMRIRSGPSGSEIAFDVGQGILERIAGKKAIFAISAKAEAGQTQMSVNCDFGEFGDCGRKRYEMTEERTDLLFEVELTSGQAGSAGAIAINSDMEKGGKAVDIYEIKVDVQ